MTSLYSDKKGKFLAKARDYYRASQAAGVEGWAVNQLKVNGKKKKQ
jgi:hypothetical protein